MFLWQASRTGHRSCSEELLRSLAKLCFLYLFVFSPSPSQSSHLTLSLILTPFSAHSRGGLKEVRYSCCQGNHGNSDSLGCALQSPGPQAVSKSEVEWKTNANVSVETKLKKLCVVNKCKSFRQVFVLGVFVVSSNFKKGKNNSSPERKVLFKRSWNWFCHSASYVRPVGLFHGE